MGKGSGLVNTWVAYVKKGKIIIEVKGVPKKLVFIAFKIIKYRIAIKMNIINRYVIDV
jgi:ribosomal protein L16/L10AE